MSGEFVIEEAEGDGGQLFRRLIFLSNQGTVQSEARLKICKIICHLSVSFSKRLTICFLVSQNWKVMVTSVKVKLVTNFIFFLQ